MTITSIQQFEYTFSDMEKFAYRSMLSIVNPQNNFYPGPLTNTFAMAHVKIAMMDEGQTIPIFAPSEKLPQLVKSIKTFVEYNCASFPGTFAISEKGIVYHGNKQP